MNNMGFGSRWIRITLIAFGSIVLVGAASLIYIAYSYWPPEDREYASPYLAELERRGVNNYLEAGAFRLHYTKQGTGEPVILLPGGGGWIYDFRNLVEALSTRYTVYAIDPPGSGYTVPLSAKPNYNELYTLESVDRALLSFMDKLGLERASLVGNSWGGGYALYFSQRHPERVAKLVSLNGTGLDLPESWLWEMTKWPVVGEAMMKVSATPNGIRKTLEGLYSGQAVRDTDIREYYVPYVFRSNLTAQWVFERNLDWRVTERLIPDMDTPLLIIWGKEDSVLDPRLYLPRWRALNPQAKIVELEGASHTPHHARPQAVNRLILNFLGQPDSQVENP